MGPKPAAAPGGVKRKGDTSNADAGRQKRAKMHAARSIPSQPASAGLHDGQLDLDAFVAAHEFEMRSLEQSIATSKAVSSSRAFQKVPRALRRRTASHNPKRVPRRLRSRARREMAEDRTPLVEARRRRPRTTRARIRAETARRLGVLAARSRRKRADASLAVSDASANASAAGASTNASAADASLDASTATPRRSAAIATRMPRPKIRRNILNSPPKPPSKFRRRQINKTWLPTHTWHAKRAHMTEPKNPLWRFAIPLTPNDKVYRPTHRAHGEKGAMVWDMSYMSTIGLYGNPVGLIRVLQRLGISQAESCNAQSNKWRIGTRAWTGIIGRDKDGFRRPICPATVFWNPQQPDTEQDPESRQVQRQVFLRVPPSAFLETFNHLLRLTKMENPRLYIEDLRFEIGSLELTGLASTEVLLSVLTPYSTKTKPKCSHAALFESLGGLTNSAALPTNAILHFAIQDPRLRYPPRKMEITDDAEAQIRLLETMAQWPAENGLQASALFDREARYSASNLPQQKSINRRRSNVTPGTWLQPTDADPPIPITLIATRPACSTHSQGAWTLLAPWTCILPLWHSIVRLPLISGLNPRFGGINQTAQVAFERGLAWFPADFLGTDAGVQWELSQRRGRRSEWERRPKSKRTEWTTVDLGAGRKGEVGDGFACDFEMLLGLPKCQEGGLGSDGCTEHSSQSSEEDNSPQSKEEQLPQRNKEQPPQSKEGPSSLAQLRLVSQDAYHGLRASSESPLSHAIVTVRLRLLTRGVVTPCARIYRLPSTPPPCPLSSGTEVPATIPPTDATSPLPHNLRAQWLARVPVPPASSRRTSSRVAQNNNAQPVVETAPLPKNQHGMLSPKNQYDMGSHPLVPDASDLVGFVTTGSFCLANGCATAIGTIALAKVLDDVRKDSNQGTLCIVRNTGQSVGWIARWQVI